MSEKTVDSTFENATTSSQYKQGLIFALIGAALFSIKPVLIKLAYQYGGDATSIMSLRAFSSLPLYLVMLIWSLRSEQNRKHIRNYGWQAAAIGILGYYLASYLDITALASISAQLERLLIFLFPTFVVLLSWCFYGQKPNRKTVSAIIIGYLGISLIVAHDFSYLGSQVWFGSGLAISSAFIFACYLILSKRIITAIGSQLFTSIGMGSAGVTILIHLQVSGLDMTSLNQELVILGVALGIFCTVLPSYFVAAAMARLTPSLLSLTSNIGPVITAIFAIAILGEPFTMFHAAGMTLVILSIIKLK
ncbi:DMT family transporter [Vibrio sp. T187]|uniref:DMT family transporter n=1 Tax=Vibrio TaxID=662 RepID=UPI0010C961AE|nr:MULTISPECIES: DMT family transporter [Vibrio]MBW3695965.1 DMT family transporter [Vibrio sp. T187]